MHIEERSIGFLGVASWHAVSLPVKMAIVRFLLLIIKFFNIYVITDHYSLT